MACLKDSILQGYLQGYLVDFAPEPLRPVVETHLASCARCRAAFDRVVATNRRVNSWLDKLSPSAQPFDVNPTHALARVLTRVETKDFLFAPIQKRSANPRAFAWSLIFQGAIIALLMLIGTTRIARTPAATPIALIAPPPQPVRKTNHARGGGQNSPLPPLKGPLPKRTPKIFTAALVAIDHPVLTLDASLIAAPNEWAAPTNAIGNPLGAIDGGGGPGHHGILGTGDGPSAGPGSGNLDDLAVFTIGNGVTKPQIISQADPEYSDEARKAKYSGLVILSIVVNTDGTASAIKLVKSLGMGLDEKAMEAVQKWRFKPGTNKGIPIRVKAQIEVNFRLL